jgi:hypothetical protein
VPLVFYDKAEFTKATSRIALPLNALGADPGDATDTLRQQRAALLLRRIRDPAAARPAAAASRSRWHGDHVM